MIIMMFLNYSRNAAIVLRRNVGSVPDIQETSMDSVTDLTVDS